jgi:hypothetical protein
MIQDVHPESGTRIRNPDPDVDLLPIPDPGPRGQRGSATLLFPCLVQG